MKPELIISCVGVLFSVAVPAATAALYIERRLTALETKMDLQSIEFHNFKTSIERML